MAKIVNITNISIREIRIAPVDDSYMISALYSQVDDSGKDVTIQWSDPINGDDIPISAKNHLDKVLENTLAVLVEKEGIL